MLDAVSAYKKANSIKLTNDKADFAVLAAEIEIAVTNAVSDGKLEVMYTPTLDISRECLIMVKAHLVEHGFNFTITSTITKALSCIIINWEPKV